MEQIKLLAAHYRSPGGEASAKCCLQDQEEHRAKSRLRKSNTAVQQVLDTEQLNNGAVNAEEGHSLARMGMCGYKHSSDPMCGYKHSSDPPERLQKKCCNKVKNARKVTPVNFLDGSEECDNQGANQMGSGSTCAMLPLQPMKLSEPGASVVNMPSLLQGQDFSDPPSGTGKLYHRRSNSQPANLGFTCSPTWGQLPGECSCHLRGQVKNDSTTATGWRRGTHSATMYTKYRSPEYALMYGELEPMATTSAVSGSSEWPANSYSKIEKIRKFG